MRTSFLVLCLLAFSPVLFGQTFHALIFADTFDDGIGSSCLNDYEQVGIEMASIANATKLTFKPYHFRDFDFNKAKVLEVLNSLKCGKDDVVFFYYTGHGARAINDQSNFPQLKLGDKDADFLPLYKVQEIIKAKNPKFSVVLGDCCNSYVEGLSPKSISGNSTVLKNSSSSNYNSLFRNLKGNIIISSSQAGQTSAAMDEGGAFTLCFLHELANVVNGNGGKVSWENLLNRSKESTYNLAKHTPVFDIQVSPEANVTPPPIEQPVVVSEYIDLSYLNELMKVANTQKSVIERRKIGNSILSKYFAHKGVKVEVVGKNSKTVVERETAENFIKRLSTIFRLAQIVEVNAKRNANGKIEELKIHEIYKE